MVSKSIILSAVIGSIVAIPPQERIVGGVEVSPKFKYPWLVSLQVNGRHNCGGIILNPTTVLTAAHCSQGSPASYTVNVHRHNLQLPASSEQGQSVRVSRVINHPSYDPNSFRNDVSIWKLSQAVTLNIDGVDLDDGAAGEQTGARVIAAGWGVTSAGGPGSPILREVSIPIVDKNTCAKYWQGKGANVSPALQVCAAAEGGKDACNGDSGGPLFTIKSNGRATLIGTTSFGQPCANRGIPTVWARTSAFRSFISQYL